MISIHCWDLPEISHSLQPVGDLKRPVWEFRVFIDGIYVGYKLTGQEGPWPLTINTSLGMYIFIIDHRSKIKDLRIGNPADFALLELNKDGEHEQLRFPHFHRELLSQSYWNPGDDLGRIKIVITEGSRDITVLPITVERVRSVVSFSYQHAPFGECLAI